MTKRLPFLLLFISIRSLSQESDIFNPDSVKREIKATEISGSLRIDGVINEPEWKLAQPSPQFIQIEPHQNKAPLFQTEVRVLYNRQFLYFGIFARDSMGKKAIRATDFKRDFDYRAHDLVNLAFDGFNDQRNAMCFVTNAYGVQRDYLSFDDLYFDIDWDGLWKVRTTRTDSGWIAEMAIPWQTLRYPRMKDSVQHWGLNIYRNRRLTNEISSFSPFPRVFSAMRMNYAGLLTNLKPPPPRTNLRVQPYLLLSYDRFKGFPTTVKPEKTTFKPGGDIKWAINTNSVLDLTANTDFAQADADQQVNNVSRFSVFFPEKRQFFLENASLFGISMGPSDDGSGGFMKVQPFFSRSIGLDTAGNPIPIDGGGRFVYRSEQRNFGVIAMHQRETSNSPGTNFFVGRFSENFGSQNRLGALVTVKNQPGGTNVASTLDGFFRLGQSHSLNTFLIHSTSTQGGKQGFAGFAQYYYTTTHVKAWLTQSVVTRDFNPAMGFVSRNDIIGTTPGLNWYYRGDKLPFKKILRAYEPGFLPEFYWQASSGKLIERSLYFFPVWINFQDGSYIGYAITPTYQRLMEPFEPLGVSIAAGEYHYTSQQLWISTDPSRILNLKGIYTWGNYFNGRLNSGDWKLQFAPIPQVSITARFNRNHFMRVGDPLTTTTIDLYGIEGRFAWNPRLQLIGFYQKNSNNSSRNYNIRFSWEYKPLSYVYIVYNHRGFNDGQGKQQTEEHTITKISYLRQF